MPDYEIIVVGAGPAGSMMTRELAKRKFSVLCIEKEIESGYPNKSTAGTPLDTFKIFELPLELGYAEMNGGRIYGPTEFYEMTGPPFARLFRFRELKQHLLKEAIRLGAHTMFGTAVVDFYKEKGKVAGVKYKGFEGEGVVTANVVVDATGPEAFLASKTGLLPDQDSRGAKDDDFAYFAEPGVGGAFEYFLENAKPDTTKTGGFYFDVFFGSKWIPGGYAWIFPTSDHEVKAGVAKMDSTFMIPGEKSQKEYFQKLWNENPQIKDAQPFEVHLGPYRHWVIGGLKHAVQDNFMVIGDAATKLHPIFGEGVRASFYSAYFATDTLKEARRVGDYSKKMLAKYDMLWQENWGMNWNISTIIYKLLYHSSDAEIDKLVRTLKKMNPQALIRLYLGRGTKEDKISLLKFIPSFLDKKTLASIATQLR